MNQYFFRISCALVFFVGLFFTLFQLTNLSKDTTGISNTAFGILAIMAALSFSCAQSLKPESEVRERFTYAAERFFHGAILVLEASVLKYGVLAVKAARLFETLPFVRALAEIALGVAAGILFLWAVCVGHTGLRIVSVLLQERLPRFLDWDDLV